MSRSTDEMMDELRRTGRIDLTPGTTRELKTLEDNRNAVLHSTVTPAAMTVRQKNELLCRLCDYGGSSTSRTAVDGTTVKETKNNPHIGRIRELLQLGAEANWEWEHGRNALWYACHKRTGNEEVQELIKASGAIPSPNEYSGVKGADLVRALQQRKRAVDAELALPTPKLTCHECNAADVALFHCGKCKWAAFCGPECQRAAWKEHKQACKPPGIEIFFSCLQGDVSKVSALVAAGVNVNICAPPALHAKLKDALKAGPPFTPMFGDNDLTRWTPLAFASFRGHANVIQILATAGANLDAPGGQVAWSPLLWSAREGHLDAVHVLVENGAYINFKGADDSGVAWTALIFGHPEIASYIMGVQTERGQESSLM